MSEAETTGGESTQGRKPAGEGFHTVRDIATTAASMFVMVALVFAW